MAALAFASESPLMAERGYLTIAARSVASTRATAFDRSVDTDRPHQTWRHEESHRRLVPKHRCNPPSHRAPPQPVKSRGKHPFVIRKARSRGWLHLGGVLDEGRDPEGNSPRAAARCGDPRNRYPLENAGLRERHPRP